MASRTESIITEYYAAFNRGDLEGMIKLLSPDVVHDINEGPTEVGVDLFEAFLGVMNKHYKESVRNLTIFSHEKRAAAEFVVDGVYLRTSPGLPEASNQEYSIPAGSFFELEAEKITRITTYYNLKAWIRLVSPEARILKG